MNYYLNIKFIALINKSNIFNKSTIIKKKDSLMDEINKLKKKKLVNI